MDLKSQNAKRMKKREGEGERVEMGEMMTFSSAKRACVSYTSTVKSLLMCCTCGRKETKSKEIASARMKNDWLDSLSPLRYLILIQ